MYIVYLRNAHFFINIYILIFYLQDRNRLFIHLISIWEGIHTNSRFDISLFEVKNRSIEWILEIWYRYRLSFGKHTHTEIVYLQIVIRKLRDEFWQKTRLSAKIRRAGETMTCAFHARVNLPPEVRKVERSRRSSSHYTWVQWGIEFGTLGFRVNRIADSTSQKRRGGRNHSVDFATRREIIQGNFIYRYKNAW